MFCRICNPAASNIRICNPLKSMMTGGYCRFYRIKNPYTKLRRIANPPEHSWRFCRLDILGVFAAWTRMFCRICNPAASNIRICNPLKSMMTVTGGFCRFYRIINPYTKLRRIANPPEHSWRFCRLDILGVFATWTSLGVFEV